MFQSVLVLHSWFALLTLPFAVNHITNLRARLALLGEQRVDELSAQVLQKLVFGARIPMGPLVVSALILC